MKSPSFGLLTILWMLFGGAMGLAATEQKHPDLGELLTQLLDHRTSNASYNARMALLKTARSDPEAMRYISLRLPGILESYHPGGDLGESMDYDNAVRLAGELKVVGAVPILCKRIDLVTGGLGGMAAEVNFLDHAAVDALIQIGPPAIPSVIDVLNHGNPLQREEAAYVLGHIGTDAAWRAVKARLPDEPDRKVRERIEELLQHPPKGRP